MIPLGSLALPDDPDALRDALQQGVARVVEPASRPPSVSVTVDPGDGSLDLVIDLSGCAVAAPTSRPTGGSGAPTSKRAVRNVRVVARPFFVDGVQAEFSLEARDVVLAVVPRGDDGWLVVDRTESGAVEASIGRADLEKLLLIHANRAAEDRGIRFRDVALELTPRGPRGVDLRLQAVAKKVVSAKLFVSASVAIDDRLDAVVSEVRASFGGFLKPILSGVMRRASAELEGHRVPLAAIDIKGARLHDLALDVTDGIRVSARLASG